jgi:signal transduction histidine kinase
VAEALANAVRHAQARTVEVSLTTAGTTVDVLVRDDGRGGAAAVPGGGLAGLAERVEGLGGRLVVGAAPGGGSLVTARIPTDGAVP